MALKVFVTDSFFAGFEIDFVFTFGDYHNALATATLGGFDDKFLMW